MWSKPLTLTNSDSLNWVKTKIRRLRMILSIWRRKLSMSALRMKPWSSRWWSSSSSSLLNYKTWIRMSARSSKGNSMNLMRGWSQWSSRWMIGHTSQRRRKSQLTQRLSSWLRSASWSIWCRRRSLNLSRPENPQKKNYITRSLWFRLNLINIANSCV